MHAWFGTHQATQKIKSILGTGRERAARCVHNYTDRTLPTPGCVTNMVKSLKWENREDRRKSARLCMLFKIQHELIDIDRQQYLTPNDSRTRGENRLELPRKIKDRYVRTIILPYDHQRLESTSS